jgi:hypothetical protein
VFDAMTDLIEVFAIYLELRYVEGIIQSQIVS